MPVEPVGAIERGQVHLLHRRQHEPRKMVPRQPLGQRRRHQQDLLAITRQEVLGHVTNRPKPAGQQALCATASRESKSPVRPFHAGAEGQYRLQGVTFYAFPVASSLCSRTTFCGLRARRSLCSWRPTSPARRRSRGSARGLRGSVGPHTTFAGGLFVTGRCVTLSVRLDGGRPQRRERSLAFPVAGGTCPGLALERLPIRTAMVLGAPVKGVR